MKITDLDKRRAIKRLPEFKKDYSRHNKLKTEDKITQFKIDFSEKWGYEFEAILLADIVAKHRRDTPTVEAVTRLTDAPYSYTYGGEEKTPSCLFGKSLYLKVTLEGKTEAQLVEDFKRTIKPYRDLLEANIPEEAKKERNRKSDTKKGIGKEHLWAVYDLYLKTHKNKVETTRQWFNVSGNPIYDFDESLLKRVIKAVSNTETIISAVRIEYDLKQQLIPPSLHPAKDF